MLNHIYTKKEPVEVIMPKEAKSLLKKLYVLRSYSGFEEPVRNFIMDFLDNHNIPYINYNGNVLGFNHPGAPLFSAHMDMVNTDSWILRGREQGVSEDAVFTVDDKACIRLYKDKDKKFQTSLGADDKNGIWVILQLLLDYKINFAFCHSEESGGAGSSQVVAEKELADFIAACQYGVIIDRRNASDIIGYNNKYCLAMDDRLETFAKANGFKYTCARGSVSDADRFSTLIECVNLSCGYYEPHTSREYTNLNELWETYLFCKKMLDDFDYISASAKRMREFKNASTSTTTYYSKYNTAKSTYDYDDYSYGGTVRYASTVKTDEKKTDTKADEKKNQKKTEAQITATGGKEDADTTTDSTTDLMTLLEEAIEYGATYVLDMDCWIVPLYNNKEYALTQEPVVRSACPSCGEEWFISQDTLDELALSNYEKGEMVAGICTMCGEVEMVQDYLLGMF